MPERDVGPEFVDFPEWVVKRLVEEGLGPGEWEQADLLRERFQELGVELKSLGSEDAPKGVVAYWTSGGFVGSESLSPRDEKRLFEALHRLVGQVADAKRKAAGD